MGFEPGVPARGRGGVRRALSVRRGRFGFRFAPGLCILPGAMETRDLLLVIGFLRGGRMFPVAAPQRGMPAQRSLRRMLDTLAESEHALAGAGAEGERTP